MKVIVYTDTQRIFSSGQIAKALRENIKLMWLSEMNRPDFRTINRFRGKIMKAVIDEVFYAVVEQLLEQGYIDLEKYFVDGIKIEANAHKYSFVWRKSTEKYKASLQEKIRAYSMKSMIWKPRKKRSKGIRTWKKLGKEERLGQQS